MVLGGRVSAGVVQRRVGADAGGAGPGRQGRFDGRPDLGPAQQGRDPPVTIAAKLGLRQK